MITKLLLHAREAALRCDVPLIERGIRYALMNCERDIPNTMLLGAASAYVQKPKGRISVVEGQQDLWHAYDVIAAGWRDSILNDGGTTREQFQQRHLRVIRGGKAISV